METWLIFAIISVFAAWFYNFTFKIAAEKNYDVSLMSIYSYVIMTILFWAYIIFINNINLNNIWIVILLALVNATFFFMSSLTRVRSMKNIDTVIFFPLYKTFWPIIVTIISIFFFKETLNIKEIIWIIIGITVPLLLITSTENKRQKNLFLWIILVLITAILTALTSSASKEIMVQWLSWSLYLFLTSIFWVFVSIISYKSKNNKNKKYNKEWFIKIAIINWILQFLAFASFMLALEWNLAIVFTINSFSILIPIILSIIFYKDHFNFKKWIVILLSIISILLFI